MYPAVDRKNFICAASFPNNLFIYAPFLLLYPVYFFSSHGVSGPKYCVHFLLILCVIKEPSLSFLIYFFLSVALQSLKDLGRLTYRRFLELFRHMVGLLGRVISPSQGLYLHRTTQHRKTRTNNHAFNGIRTHDPSNQPAKTYVSDRTATVTGFLI
jgi:hypothetical protein